MATLTEKYKSYPAYRPSVVEWLGEIPAHWEVKRLKYIATVNDEALPETTDPDLEITYVDIGNVDSVRGITGTEDLAFENAPSRARRIVRQGDVIISTVRTYLKAITRIEPTDVNLIVSTGFAVVRPQHLHDGFVAYALSSPYFVERVVAHSTGVSYPAINASELACLDIAIPPLPEQYPIVAFLDREAAKIDELVARKEQLIGLLQEKRTALITRAVTRGLDPNTPMKDSGVEWLGEIPAHWEVKQMKYVARIEAGQSPPSEMVSQEVNTLPFLQGNAEFGDISPSPRFACEDAPQKCSTGDILLSVRAPVGAVNIADQAYGIGRGLCAIRPSEDLEGRFTYHLLYVVRSCLSEMATGSTYDAVTVNDVGGIPAILPPLPEQRSITAFLDQETARIDALAARVREAMDRLKELRTALISAAVTGRIDVREEAG